MHICGKITVFAGKLILRTKVNGHKNLQGSNLPWVLPTHKIIYMNYWSSGPLTAETRDKFKSWYLYFHSADNHQTRHGDDINKEFLPIKSQSFWVTWFLEITWHVSTTTMFMTKMTKIGTVVTYHNHLPQIMPDDLVRSYDQQSKYVAYQLALEY